MKITINKEKVKYFILAGIILVVVLLLSGLLVYENWNLNRGSLSLNKFEEIIDLCEREGQFGNLNFKCKAFLERYEEKDINTDCFYLSIITKEPKTIKMLLCAEKGSIDWDPEVMISERQILVDVNLEYRNLLLGTYKFNNMKYSLIKDEEIRTIVENLITNHIEVPLHRTQLEAELINKGYYTTNTLDIADGQGFSTLLIYTGDVKEVTAKDSTVYLNTIFSIEGKEYATVLSSRSFLYLGDYGFRFSTVTASNFSDFKILGKNQIMFFYLDSKSTVTEEQVDSFCANPEKLSENNSLCLALETRSLEELKIDDIDKYILDLVKNSEDRNVNFDKLIFSNLILRP